MRKNNELMTDDTYSLVASDDESGVGWGDASDEDGGLSGAGGQTGAVEFRYRDAYSLGPRDDMLPPAEINRQLAVHEDQHKYVVAKAKDVMAERKARKEGKHTIQYQNQAVLGGGGGMQSRYKKHPIADKFSGIRDEPMTPAEFDKTLNEEMQDKLENRLENRLQNKLAMANRPTNTPRLTRK